MGHFNLKSTLKDPAVFSMSDAGSKSSGASLVAVGSKEDEHDGRHERVREGVESICLDLPVKLHKQTECVFRYSQLLLFMLFVHLCI